MERVGPGQVVAEVVMKPETTPLLIATAARDARAHPGRPMLAGPLELMAAFPGMAPAARART